LHVFIIANALANAVASSNTLSLSSFVHFSSFSVLEIVFFTFGSFAAGTTTVFIMANASANACGFCNILSHSPLSSSLSSSSSSSSSFDLDFDFELLIS
jgi:hypothetical protein